jgi:hypothetical protein
MRRFVLSSILMPGLLVIGISCTRMYLVVVGQWDADQSWSYDPLLAIEVSEIGTTLIALSIPALKPLFLSMTGSLPSSSGGGSSWASYTRSKLIGKSTPGELGGSHSKEIRPQPSPTESQIDLKAGPKHSPAISGWVGEKVAEKGEGIQYSAAALHARQDRDPSIRSDASHQHTIKYHVEYSVSHEEAALESNSRRF